MRDSVADYDYIRPFRFHGSAARKSSENSNLYIFVCGTKQAGQTEETKTRSGRRGEGRVGEQNKEYVGVSLEIE